MKRTMTSLAILLLVLFTLSTQAQTTWFVTPGALATGTGSSWADPMPFQTAINSAASGDNVFVAQGTYQPAAGSFFSMKQGVKIYGGFAGTETTLSQRDLTAGYISTLKGNGVPVVANPAGLTTISVMDGFTITGGKAPDYGAGMTNTSSSPTISNCVFANNSGGGLFLNMSSPVIVKCVFTGNTAPNGTLSLGGGIYMINYGRPSILNCVFYNNQGLETGAIYAQDITAPSIINCTFYGNYNSYASIGGIDICLNIGNTAKIENCIIWGNNSAIYSDPSYIPVSLNNIVQGGYLGSIDIDPQFVNPSNGAGADGIWGTADDGLRIQSSSLALNGGTPDTTGLHLPTTDLTGAPRVQDSKIDIGAYEQAFTCNPRTTVYVDGSVAASGDGSSWATAYKTLDESLGAAGQCSNITSIYVAQGTYQPSTGNSFSMVPHVAIYGGFPIGGGSFSQRNTTANTTILQGNGSGRPIVYNYNTGLDNSAVLDGFTITGGNATYGAGMYNYIVSPAIINCVFLNNTATDGGAIYNTTGSAPLISGCTFSGNSASMTGYHGGGAIRNDAANAAITHCFFYNNSAILGGAVFEYLNSYIIISNSVFIGNNSASDGAAIENVGNKLEVINVTFANNNSGGGGGGIDNWGSALSVTNSVFWGNTSAHDQPDLWFETGGLDMIYNFTQSTFTGTGNVLGSVSPFMNIANPIGPDGVWGTSDDGLVLTAGSPAIDAGTPDTTGMNMSPTDIIGNPRVAGAAIDMGAYENSVVLPIVLVSFTGNLDAGIANLQWQTGVADNFNHFEVEKSTDGSSFQTKGQVSFDKNRSRYTFRLPQPEPSALYRLKLVDIDGKSSYSRTILLSQNANTDVFVYPVPATDHLNVQVEKAGVLAIYAADGKQVKSVSIQAGINNVDISSLGRGVYYGEINGVQVKFIKL